MVRVDCALDLFRKTRRHHALVVNEFGAVIGLLTINDIFDALVGDIGQEPEPQEVVKREDGSYLIDAQIPFAEFAEQFHLTPAERRGLTGFHTLGGFLLYLLNAVPRVGQHITWQGHYFEAIDMDRSRIDKILYRPKQVA